MSDKYIALSGFLKKHGYSAKQVIENGSELTENMLRATVEHKITGYKFLELSLEKKFNKMVPKPKLIKKREPTKTTQYNLVLATIEKMHNEFLYAVVFDNQLETHIESLEELAEEYNYNFTVESESIEITDSSIFNSIKILSKALSEKNDTALLISENLSEKKMKNITLFESANLAQVAKDIIKEMNNNGTI